MNAPKHTVQKIDQVEEVAHLVEKEMLKDEEILAAILFGSLINLGLILTLFILVNKKFFVHQYMQTPLINSCYLQGYNSQ